MKILQKLALGGIALLSMSGVALADEVAGNCCGITLSRSHFNQPRGEIHGNTHESVDDGRIVISLRVTEADGDERLVPAVEFDDEGIMIIGEPTTVKMELAIDVIKSHGYVPLTLTGTDAYCRRMLNEMHEKGVVLYGERNPGVNREYRGDDGYRNQNGYGYRGSVNGGDRGIFGGDTERRGGNGGIKLVVPYP